MAVSRSFVYQTVFTEGRPCLLSSTFFAYAHVLGNKNRDAAENRSAQIEQFAAN